jgi:hypothetical protein
VDNGPTSFVQPKNSRLYSRHGFNVIARALKPAGKVAFWSACPEPGFIQCLNRAGFTAEAVPAKSHERAKREAHVIYLAGLAGPDADAEPTIDREPAERSRFAKPKSAPFPRGRRPR